MAFDFPASPTNGQVFTSGGVSYVWNGQGWVQQGAPGSVDKSYVDAADALKVAKAGDTMSGPLVLPADPTLALQAAPKQYVDAVRAYAAPFDALAYNGMQINGSMDVSQERGAAFTTITSFICDGWKLLSLSSAGISAAAISAGGFLPGLINHILANTTTPAASLTTTQQNAIVHTIEGYRISRLAWGTASAKPLTIGFFTGHHRTGTYSVSTRNFNDTRSYVATYTQNAADTWEYKTITIPGDTAGTWNSDNTTGMTINFVQACGPTYTAPAANTWYGATYVAAPTQVNAVAATSDVFRLSGVIVLPGLLAPTAAQSLLIMRPYDQELIICNRYFEPMKAAGGGYALTTTAAVIATQFTKKRASPTLLATAGSYTVFQYGNLSATTTPTIGAVSDTGATVNLAGFTGLVQGAGLVLVAAPASIFFDARL